MSKSEFKMRYDPEIGRYVTKHIYTKEIHGEGLMDIFRSVGSKLFGKTSKEIAKKSSYYSSHKSSNQNRGTLW